MVQIPPTTLPTPDQARLADLLRRLADVMSPDAPVLSVYLDLRPEAQADRPGERNQLIVLRERLRAISETFEPHSEARSSLDADAARLWRYLEDESLVTVEGVAVFACADIGLWETVTAPVPFAIRVSAGPNADLFDMAGLVERSESVVVALVDTNTCRFFVTRRGVLVERSGLDEPTEEHQRHHQGGWAQARYQRHIDMQDRRFAAEAAAALARLTDEVHARHVVLAGEERATSVLQEVLPAAVAARVERVERIAMRADAGEVASDIAPIVAALRRSEEQDAADRVIAGVRAGDLAVAGVDEVQEALERGQVHELVIDAGSSLDDDLRGELVREAAATDAGIVTVDEHTGLRARGGVGATLRWRS